MSIRNAVITGASGGIGGAIARRLTGDGLNCVLVARNEGRLNETAVALAASGRTVLVAPCDVTQPVEVEALFDVVRDRLGQIDVLVNCAGRAGGGVTSAIADELWLDVINTNLNSVFFVTRTALRSQAIRRGGSIINIASTGGKQGVLHGAPSSASKHGVIGFTKALGIELARAGADITVNAVCPSFVEGGMAETIRNNFARLWGVSRDEATKRIAARLPIGRFVQPDEVAAMVSYLASGQARSVTAQALNVCGGLGRY